MTDTLDLQAIENLKALSGGGNDLVKKVIGSFLRTSPEILERLKGEMIAGEWVAMARTAHQLKSGGAYVGGRRFVELLGSFELPGSNFSKEEGLIRLEGLVAEFEALRAALRPLVE